MSAKDNNMTTLAKPAPCEKTDNAVNKDDMKMHLCHMVGKEPTEMAEKIKV